MLKRKLLRDIWKQKTSFLAIFLLMLMGCYIFAGITGEYNGMLVSADAYIAECNMADATVVSTYRPELSKDVLTQDIMLLQAHPKNDEDTILDVNVIKESKISTMKLMYGNAYAQGKQGIWIDERFARANGLSIHDSYTLSIANHDETFEIQGFILSPDYIYQSAENQVSSDHVHTGYAYLDASSIAIPFTANRLLIQSDRSDLKEYLQNAFANTSSMIVMQKDHPSYSMIHDEIEQHKQLGMIFSISFLGIALLVSITTIHRLLHSQQLQLGILQALGFSHKQLYLHYSGHCALISLIASALGCLTGGLSFSALTYPFMEALYTLPKLQSVPLTTTYILPFLITLCSICIALFITHRYLYTPTTAILRGMSKQCKLYTLPAFCSHFSFITQWNLRDIVRNRLRSVMSIFGVFGCTALLICAFGIYTTITQLSTWTFTEIEAYDCRINGSFQEDLRTSLLQQMQGSELMLSIADIKTDAQQGQITLSVYSDTRYTRLAVNQTTFITLHDGIGISKNIAQEYQIRVGDVIQWKPLGTNTWQTNTVEAILRTPLTQGIFMMKDQYNKQNLNFQATALVGHIPEYIPEQSTITSIQYHEDMLKSMDTLMDAMVMMIAIFVLAAVLLGSVILYNLGSLNYMERLYELSTLQVLGFQSRSIRSIMIQQTLWLTLAGTLLGIPGGYLLLSFMLSTIQASMDVMLYVPVSVIALSYLGTLFLSFFIIVLVSRKAKQIDMVAALKANE